MHENDLTFFDQEALLYRLRDGLENSEKDVVFVVGAPLTAPVGNQRGVANVDGVVELIRSEFNGKKSQVEKLESELRTSKNNYQTAFEFLVGRVRQLCSDIDQLHGTPKILGESDATRAVQNWMRN